MSLFRTNRKYLKKHLNFEPKTLWFSTFFNKLSVSKKYNLRREMETIN